MYIQKILFFHLPAKNRLKFQSRWKKTINDSFPSIDASINKKCSYSTLGLITDTTGETIEVHTNRAQNHRDTLKKGGECRLNVKVPGFPGRFLFFLIFGGCSWWLWFETMFWAIEEKTLVDSSEKIKQPVFWWYICLFLISSSLYILIY